MSFEGNEDDLKTDMQAWLGMVDDLSEGLGWATDELPLEIVQTHISVILLGKRHALKLKKPVDFGFLDYTTSEKRRRACEAEVTLNRRLCGDTYLGVQPIVEVNGQPRLAKEGRVIDFGVWMKKLADDRMLDRMVARDMVTEAMMDRVAERLSAFHQEARRGSEVDFYGSPQMIHSNWQENFEQTDPYVGRTINSLDFDLIQSRVRKWLNKLDGLFRRRVREGRIVDGHGDLRSESICITDGICIFDCIEFNDRFRCGDVASEVAFLEMDLAARGRPDLGHIFSESYQKRASDPELFALLPFYRCYRAFVRGKVLSFRLDETEFSETEHRAAALQAKNYFRLAGRYATPLKTPTMIAVMGLSGTGKTSVARAIAAELGLRVVSSDAIRKSRFGNGEQPIGHEKEKYSTEANRFTYNKLLDRGRTLLKENGGVILDATFQRAADRARAQDTANSLGANWRLIECHLLPDLIHSRLDKRTSRREGLSDATWDVYLRQREESEPLNPIDQARHLLLDTRPTLSVTSRAACDWLRENDRT